MPPVAAWAVHPPAAEQFSRLSRSSLRALYLAGLIPMRSQLRAADVVIARLCRYLYWSGPAASAPGHSEERDKAREVAATVVKKVRPLLRPRAEVPGWIVVSTETGKVVSIEKPSQWVDLTEEKDLLVARMDFPLSHWWEEAKQLPTGAQREGGK